MKGDCGICYEDAIWRHARTGEELPAEVREHIENCPECGQMLSDAQRLSQIIAADDYERQAPDCRSAVMSRICAPAGRFRRHAWVYACVLALIAIIGAAILFTGDSFAPSPIPMASKRVQPQRLAKPKSGVAPQAAVPRTERMEMEAATAPAPAAVEEQKLVFRTDRPKPRRVVFAPRPKQIRREPPAPAPVREPSRSPDAAEVPSLEVSLNHVQDSTLNLPERPIAAVAVTWPQSDEGTDTSYSYVEHDAETGTVTSCSVRRTGDSVEIYMESTPGGGNEPPVKGSADDENTINA